MRDEIAILITTYNRLEFLKKTLKSLHESLKNDNNNVTIFIVDDGSTDGTSEWIRQDNIEWAYNTQNKGLRYSMNRGLGIILNREFDYISYNQDDVEFEPGWLQKCINCWMSWEKAYKYYSSGLRVGFVTGHDAPEHKTIKLVKTHYGDIKWKRTCRATHIFASAERWKEFGEIPDLTPGIAAPKPGQGSKVDWWLVGHPEGKYPESKNSLRVRDEWVMCLPGQVRHSGWKIEDSTWENLNYEQNL